MIEKNKRLSTDFWDFEEWEQGKMCQTMQDASFLYCWKECFAQLRTFFDIAVVIWSGRWDSILIIIFLPDDCQNFILVVLVQFPDSVNFITWHSWLDWKAFKKTYWYRKSHVLVVTQIIWNHNVRHSEKADVL